MDSYISADEARRKPGQIFGTADELRVLRTLNARANAMRRMAGSKADRRANPHRIGMDKMRRADVA
jgi:hypothetical protein